MTERFKFFARAADFLKDFFRTKTIIKTLAVIALVWLSYTAIKWIPTLQIRREPLPDIPKTELLPAIDEIDKAGGIALAYENDTKRMYVDPSTLNIRIEDKETGIAWNSIGQGANLSADDSSIIKINFLAEDDSTFSWDSYTYAILGNTYNIYRIEGGVRIVLDMKEMDSTRINEYMPQKISAERYEEVFVRGLESKVEEGVLTSDELAKYQSTLGLIYALDEENGYYYFKFLNSPPGSAVRQLIEVTKILDYTTDDLMMDNAEYDIYVEIEKPANFIIPLEIVLDGNDVIARISTYNIENINEYYMLTHIDVLPNFGAVTAGQAENGGYMLVPDGAGALLELNNFDANFGSYYRPVYYNTFFKDMYSMPSFPEDLTMPVFGMTYGKNEEASHSFLGIIEKGAEVAYIGAVQASKDEGGGGAVYNRIYSAFDTAQYAQIAITDAGGGGAFVAGTGVMDMDYAVRYKLYTGGMTYFDMAMEYRQYLMDTQNLTLSYQNEPKLALDVLGALTVQGRFFGLEYSMHRSLTPYTELTAILQDLGGVPLIVNYKGFFDGGMNGTVMNKAKLTSTNGTKRQLSDLLDYAAQNNTEIFMQTNLSRVYKEGKGFDINTHSIYGYGGTAASIMPYNYATGAMKPFSNWYYLINPVYLSSVTDSFLANAQDYTNLSIADLAVDYYANYKKNQIVSPAQAQAIVSENLDKLYANKTLALVNPNMDKIHYGEYALDISRESSGYGAFYSSIPFRQLAMNGLIEYTTLNVNNAGVSSAYYLLQALELGSYPKYEISGKNIDFLKHTTYTDFLSVEYGLISSGIKSLYAEYADAYSKIGTNEIINHRQIDKNVFETTYANGTKVLVNYNKFSVDIDEGEIEPLGYIITQNR